MMGAGVPVRAQIRAQNPPYPLGALFKTGGARMRFAAPLESTLPDELRALGYVVVPAGSTMRINPHGTVEVIAAARSSMPPLRQVTHAAIEQMNVYDLTVPPSASR